MTPATSHLMNVQTRRREAAAALLLLGGEPPRHRDGRMPGCPHCGDPRIAIDEDGKYYVRRRTDPRPAEVTVRRAQVPVRIGGAQVAVA